MKKKFVTTREASNSCGVSTQFLKKNRDIHGGFLEEEVHYILGTNINSSILWDVDEILKTTIDQNGIFRLTLNSQHNHNALSEEMMLNSESGFFMVRLELLGPISDRLDLAICLVKGLLAFVTSRERSVAHPGLILCLHCSVLKRFRFQGLDFLFNNFLILV